MKRLGLYIILFLTSLLFSGCATYTGDGRTVLGSRQQQPRQSPEQIAAARRDARIATLESFSQRQANEADGINESINSLSARVDGFTRQMDARGSDVVALRAEADKLRRDIDLINNKLDAIPQTFSKLLEEQRRSIMAEVNRNISTSVANVQRQRTSSGSSGSGKFYEHEVQSGQTLSEIARVYEVTMAEIMRENKIKDASLIRVGQKLLIPAK